MGNTKSGPIFKETQHFQGYLHGYDQNNLLRYLCGNYNSKVPLKFDPPNSKVVPTSWYLPTKLRGISSETGRTTAAGGVVDHVALGRDATDSRTGIAALVVEAGAVLRAVTIEHALWAALRVRVSIILR